MVYPLRARRGGAAAAGAAAAAAAAAVALILAAFARTACAGDFSPDDADTASPITDRFYLRASYFRPSLTTQLRLDPAGDPLGGTSLSGEHDLGFPSHANQGLVEVMFRLRKRNRVRVDYLQLNSSGSATLTQPAVFGDQMLYAGDRINSSLLWRKMGFTWTYAFIQNDRFELGAGLGVQLMDVDVTGSVPARFESYQTSAAGALPAPALDAIWNISSRFALTARAQYLHAAIHENSGSLADYHTDVQYRWQANFAVGLGYSFVHLAYDSLTQGNPGRLSMQLAGPEAFVRVSF